MVLDVEVVVVALVAMVISGEGGDDGCAGWQQQWQH